MKEEQEEIKRLFNELSDSQEFLFPKKGNVKTSNKQGVYIIYSPSKEVLHVGRTSYGKDGLNGRLSDHITKAGVFYKKYLKPNGIEMRGQYIYKIIEVESSRSRALLEALTAGLLCPTHIGTGEKKNKS